MTPQTDRELIESIQRGQDDAFRVLVERYLPTVYGFVLRMLRDRHDAEDVTQEVFINVWRKFSSYNPAKSFKTWILTIARNAAIDHLRKKNPIPFSRLMSDDDQEVAIDVADPRPLADTLLEQKELGKQIDEALGEISVPSREVVLMHDAEDLTFQEIANTVHEPMNTVKSRYRRAVARLRKTLAPEVRDAPKTP